MSLDRRKFVKYAGLTAAGLLVRPPLRLFAGEVEEAETGKEAIEAATRYLPPRAAHPPENASRWAMLVDLKKCRQQKDCSACIDACHRIHNVPDWPTGKDEVKWILKEHFGHAFPDAEHEYVTEHIKHSNVLLLCNHCDNPPCVRVCPTGATWKRESDGLVMMDWHRCIGCRYCIAACPYGSRSFNYREPKKYFADKGTGLQPDFPARTRGVVEKCTFCEERLARGQWPACVEACPHDALVFGDLDNPDDPVRELLKHHFTIRRKPGLGTQPEVYYIV